MDQLPVELVRCVYAYLGHEDCRNLRVNRHLAHIGYEFILAPKFILRNNVDHLFHISQHPQLRGQIESIVVDLADPDDFATNHDQWLQHLVLLPLPTQLTLTSACDGSLDSRKVQFLLEPGNLREAFLGLPNLKHLEIVFNRPPVESNVRRDFYGVPNCRKMDRAAACTNLNTLIAALHDVNLESFTCDRFPLELLKVPSFRKHWFAHVKSFSSLTRLELTMDPSGLQGPMSTTKAVNGLGYILQWPTRLQQLKLSFHPYTSPDSKFALCFQDLLNGRTYDELTDLTLAGISCEEDDLKDFLVRHGSTLRRLRLGGRGLAKPYQASLGGVHLHEGTLKSLFYGLRPKLTCLERLHLEGIFECEQSSLNFYALTDESWVDVARPAWARQSRETINCLPFEEFLVSGGSYPGRSSSQQND